MFIFLLLITSGILSFCSICQSLGELNTKRYRYDLDPNINRVLQNDNLLYAIAQRRVYFLMNRQKETLAIKEITFFYEVALPGDSKKTL